MPLCGIKNRYGDIIIAIAVKAVIKLPERFPGLHGGLVSRIAEMIPHQLGITVKQRIALKIADADVGDMGILLHHLLELLIHAGEGIEGQTQPQHFGEYAVDAVADAITAP